jgi:type I restriction enzyme, S subunit
VIIEPKAIQYPTVELHQVAELCLGKMLDKEKNKGRLLPYLRNPNVRWFEIDTSNLQLMPFEPREDDRYGLRSGDVLVCEGGEPGRAAIWDGRLADVKFQKAIHRVRPGPNLDARYFVHRLMHDYHRGALGDYYTGATIKHLTGQDFARYRFPLPPLAEQRRIAVILDKADALRAKRRLALAQLDTLTQSIFVQMFGDPAMNPKRWRCAPLGELAVKFSDGPFGSNLKTEHYAAAGVRVVRLQNIGVDEFLDDDAAYISERHFGSLVKHECLSGDVLVGTLGDPNLRACIQPQSLPRMLNKADCVQIRVDERVSHAAYVCALLNHSSTARMAQALVLGQTRSRISMGRLRSLRVPVPPVELQRHFAKQRSQVEGARATAEMSLTKFNELFAALQHRAFRGEL